MDTTRSESHNGGRERSHSDPAAPQRRRSLSGSWFKRLGQKFSNDAHNIDIPERKRGSAGSLYTMNSQSGDDEPLKAHSFKEDFLRFGRRGSTSSNGVVAGSPGSSTGFSSGNDESRRATRTTSAQSGERDSSRTTSSDDLVDPLESQPKKPPAPSSAATLEDLERHGITTRHVGFALSTFADDPPQRIPPMRPLKGNVEFTRTGELILSARPRHYAGMGEPYLERNHCELSGSAQSRAHQNAERLHVSIHNGGAGISALFSGFGQKSASEVTLDEDETMNSALADHDVDGTAHVVRKQSQQPNSSTAADADWISHTPNPELALTPDQIYVRCCHLREIMPIRNILRQLQGQRIPIPRLRIANTKPTLVEIQAFSDFLTVVPVAAMALDNHIMTAEMVRYLMIGLTRSRDIGRLTFTNTDLDDEAWQYLCAFLASNRKTLLALSLSCTDPTGVPDRVKPFNRRKRDWRLLSQALETMGSLEELDLSGTGIGMGDLDHLIHQGFKNGRVLGLANSGFSYSEMKQVALWANSPTSKLMGLNLSGNDFSQDEDLSVVQSLLTNQNILQLSLRNTNLSQAHADKFVEQVAPEKAAMSSLRQLDLSRNPKLFPAIMNRLVESLAKFPFLSRLLLDHCGLTSDAIVMLCEALSHCHRLVFVSFVGNGKLTETAATAVCVAVHQSRSICTVEADMQEWPASLRQQLAKYCIQNLERNSGALGAATPTEEENRDIADFYEELRAVKQDFEVRGQQVDPAAALRRIETLRKGLTARVQTLLMKRRERSLSVTEREALIRLYFYGNSLDRLQKQATGSGPMSGAETEEAVKNVEEDEIRPPLSRPASQASILSLKKLEREEGHAHKKYTERLQGNSGGPPVDNIEKLSVDALEKIIS